MERWPQWATIIDEKMKMILDEYTIEKRDKDIEFIEKTRSEIEEKKENVTFIFFAI